MYQEWRKDLPIKQQQQQHIIIIIIIIIKIIRIILIRITMIRRTTQPICWERRKLVVYTVENWYILQYL